jgi:hypothetical protein
MPSDLACERPLSFCHAVSEEKVHRFSCWLLQYSVTKINSQYQCRGPRYLSRYSYSLRPGRSKDRIPVGTEFSAPVQSGPGDQPASCKWVSGFFPRGKRPERGVDHPPQSSAEWSCTSTPHLCLYGRLQAKLYPASVTATEQYLLFLIFYALPLI